MYNAAERMEPAMAIPAFSKSKKIVATNLLMLFLAMTNLLRAGVQKTASAQEVLPVLEFPEAGLDDTSTYRGYTTRFFRDSAGNTLQIYISQNNGRVVNLWADAANESIAFTARDAAGQPATLTWGSPAAKMTSDGKMRYVEYSLSSNSSVLEVGLFVLNTMRLERDFQYFKQHTLPFDSEPFIAEGFTQLIRDIERLPPNVQGRHLGLLNATSLAEIRSRLLPQTKLRAQSSGLVEQPTFDGKNHLSLELYVDSGRATIDVSQNKISIHSLRGQPIVLGIKVGTDSPALKPLQRNEIFNSDFFQFYEHVKSEHDSSMRSSGATGKDLVGDERRPRFKRLERQVKSMELMSAQEKLLAGLPNYATYFGRDMMMSALMLEPVWQPAMLEHVIASVLRKLSPSGEVSHEEGLGNQAIRENAAQYNKLMAAYFQQKSQGDNAAANKILAMAEKVLGNLQTVTENYHMVDDDFQLSVLTARYLARTEIPVARKREFLRGNSGKDDGISRLALLIRNLLYVAQISRSYVSQPVAENLISFKKLDQHRWHSGSWRDSGVGYANGRFAMDINGVWVPKALESIEKILTALREIGFSSDDLQKLVPELHDTQLFEYAQKPEILRQAIKTWRNAVRHFEVHLPPQEVQRRVRAKLHSLSEEERSYWEKAIAKSAAGKEGVQFLALALDEKGQPLPVANTDVVSWLFLENLTEKILQGEIKSGDVLDRLKIFGMSYPVGLFLEGVGPVVANDAYADSVVWKNFERDHYHSPRVVWGREVNQLFLGLSKQILAAYNADGQIKDASLDSYVKELRALLNQTHTAVEASGLKHNELWSYRIANAALLPARYASTTDIQLWNLTDLAVQFMLARVAKL
jgi:hypothetical protein